MPIVVLPVKDRAGYEHFWTYTVGEIMGNKGIVVLLFFLIPPTVVQAVAPQFWENFTQADLLKGNFDRLSLTPDGRIFPAPAYDLLYDTGQPYIFSMVRDKAGNIYVGTGDDGKVFKIDPQGKGSLYFQSKELNVFALALDDADLLYVGTSPDGKVYKVTGPNQATEFCNPESKYIWSLVFDNVGNLYVGTGANGIIYKVDKTGAKSIFYTCADNHVVSLARTESNSLLAGTSPRGLIMEITPGGKGFALLDASLEEIRSLAIDRFGTIYAVAVSSKAAEIMPASKQPTPSGSSTISSTVTIDSVISAAEKPKEAKSVSALGGEKDSAAAKSAVYAVSKDGSVETVYSSNDHVVFHAALRDDGSVVLATGSKGRLLLVDTAKQITVISDCPDEDLTRVLIAGDAIYVSASNQGKVYRFGNERAKSGTYESQTLDAKTVASWGKISWRISNSTGAKVELFTRTGNTDKPDSSWSDWSTAYTSPGQQITSPRARYLQWRATFTNIPSGRFGTISDVLEQVQIAYLQQNLRPQVTNIEVLPYGIELQKQPMLAAGGQNLYSPSAGSDGRSLNAPRERGRERQPLAPRQVLQPGAQSFTWKAVDDNNDTLEYSLYFKGEGENEWKLLERKLTDTFYTLNVASLPDGVYRLKVVASDAPSNPYDKFLIGELISEPFVITNATPQVEITGTGMSGKKVEVQFRARVSTGHIASAEFSIDGGEWLLVFPTDGIADSMEEEYQISTPELTVGEHLIGVRASDGNGNTGTAKVVIKIP